MSSSESEDFEGFESAEEDLPVSDIDEDEIDELLARDPSAELLEKKPSDRDSKLSSDGLDFNEPPPHDVFKSDLQPLSTITNVDLVSKNAMKPEKCFNTQDVNNSVQSKITVESSNPIERLDNAGSNKAVKSSERSERLFENSLETEEHLKDRGVPKDNYIYDNTRDKTATCPDVLDNESLMKSVEAMTITSNKTENKNNCATNVVDSNSNGWDFEDDDIDLVIPKENNPLQLSISSGKSCNDFTQPLMRNSGDVSSLTNDTGVANSPSGWDFDEDVKLPDSPEKKMELPKELASPPSASLLSNNQVWSSWGSWGVSNLLSSATEGVSTLTQMTTGLTSMLENTLGAPDPEVLASQLSVKRESEEELSVNSPKEQDPSELTDVFGLGNIIGGVKTLGNKVIDGGLETLETLGKKTMEVLQEGDPGLKKKRALLFSSDKVILSQVLRDAKEKAEASEQQENMKVSRKAQYETLFDDFHGLVHLEALEMISRQCEIKIQSVSSNSPKCSLDEFTEAVNFVKQLYEQNENSEEDEKQSNDDIKDVLNNCMDSLSLNINTKNFIEVYTSIQSRLSQAFSDATDIHTNAISDLAQFTACAIELFHRIAELFIVKGKSNIENDFKALSRVANVSKFNVGTISESYSAKLMLLHDKSASPLITNVFLEASNSSTYLDNALELFTPILQLKALQSDVYRN